MSDLSVAAPRGKRRSIPAILFSVSAILAGLQAFLQAGLRGHSAGWEEMSLYTGPSVLFALLAIALRRSALSYVALGFAALSVVGFFLGA